MDYVAFSLDCLLSITQKSLAVKSFMHKDRKCCMRFTPTGVIKLDGEPMGEWKMSHSRIKDMFKIR